MDRDLYYTLDADHNPVATDLMTWAEWFEDGNNRIVAHDHPRPGVLVSTVCLGVDHNFSGKGRPILFETMVCRNGKLGDEQRYCTWDEAERGHAEALERVMGE